MNEVQKNKAVGKVLLTNDLFDTDVKMKDVEKEGGAEEDSMAWYKDDEINDRFKGEKFRKTPKPPKPTNMVPIMDLDRYR